MDCTVPALVDSFGRRIGSVRLSITDRCNLRCQYCMPEEGVAWKHPDEILSFEEMLVIVRVFHDLGIHQFRLTGGEPTVRQDLPVLCRMIRTVCSKIELSMTTNGIRLRQLAQDLYNAGLQRVNISLDTLDPQKFHSITRRDLFDQVMEGVLAAKQLPFQEIKLNAVAIRGFNDNELSDFITFSERQGIPVRFIEFMPFTGNNWGSDAFISKKELIETVQGLEELVPLPLKDLSQTSREYSARNGKANIGFIASVSESFCGSCNRLRLTSEGYLRTCLHNNHEVYLRELTADRRMLEARIRLAVAEKWAGHPDFQKMHYQPPVSDRAMILIGG